MASDFEDHCWKDIVPPDVLGHLHPLRAQDLRRAGAGADRDRSLRTRPTRAARGRWPSWPRPIRARAARTPMRRSSRPGACSPPRAPPACRCSTRPWTRARDSLPTARDGDQAAQDPGRSRALRDPRRLQAAARRRGDHQAARERVLRHAAGRASDPARRAHGHHLRREHVGLRARLGGRRLFARLPRGRWSRSAASTAACCRTRSTCSTCITNMPTS